MVRRAGMKEAVPTPVDDLAVLVWAQLAEAEHNGLAIWELERCLPDLTRSQIHRGIARINHVLQLTQEQPVAIFRIRGRGHVYRLPEHCPDYKTFALRRLKELVTRAHTELIRSEAAVLRWPDGLAVYLPKMLRRAIEDIEDMMVELMKDNEDERQDTGAVAS